MRPSPEVVEIPVQVECFNDIYLPYLNIITPPFNAHHEGLNYGELKYRYNHLIYLLGESNKDKESIKYILDNPNPQE